MVLAESLTGDIYGLIQKYISGAMVYIFNVDKVLLKKLLPTMNI